VRFHDFPNAIQEGGTEHLNVYYDPALGARGKAIAREVLAACERDYNSINTLFGGIEPLGLPINIIVARLPENERAYHYGCSAVDLYCDAQTLPVVNARYTCFLAVTQLVEVFSAAQERGWDCSKSNGEGLSRVLAAPFYPRQSAGFITAAAWLDRGRDDYVHQNHPTDTHPIAIGCAVLFLNYLHYQLGHNWDSIVAAAGPTLVEVYHRLTGDHADPWPAFRDLLGRHFPIGRPSGLTTDNPFPLGGPSAQAEHEPNPEAQQGEAQPQPQPAPPVGTGTGPGTGTGTGIGTGTGTGTDGDSSTVTGAVSGMEETEVDEPERAQEQRRRGRGERRSEVQVAAEQPEALPATDVTLPLQRVEAAPRPPERDTSATAITDAIQEEALELYQPEPERGVSREEPDADEILLDDQAGEAQAAPDTQVPAQEEVNKALPRRRKTTRTHGQEQPPESPTEPAGPPHSGSVVDPAELQRFLNQATYPIHRRALAQLAQREGASEAVLDALSRLPERRYESPRDVSREIGNLT
jgi:hypothetical protein